MSENGLKTAGKIYYTDKFKGIQWTDQIKNELPIKFTEFPPISEWHYSIPWRDNLKTEWIGVTPFKF